MGLLRNIFKRVTHPFLQKGLNYYYRKPRNFSYKGLSVLVHPDVFPPHMTLSTKILLDFISEMELTRKLFLELGCGSGIISLHAKKKGAIVTASDINETALEYLKNASERTGLELNCIKSDLFSNISEAKFDIIIVNPPYYPKAPSNIKQHAWYCGENFEYFEAFFVQIKPYLTSNNKTYMILSEDCELEKIETIANINNVTMNVILEKKKVGEKNYIFEIASN